MNAAALQALHELLDRAIYDLANGWPEAAADALGRARRLAQSQIPAPGDDTVTDRKTPQTEHPVTDRWPESDIGRKTESPRYSEQTTPAFPVSPAQRNDDPPTA